MNGGSSRALVDNVEEGCVDDWPKVCQIMMFRSLKVP